jgi:hypothetical protein
VGRGNLVELQSDGPDGHLDLLALRLYSPGARQWNLYFATSRVGILGMPATTGEFSHGVGEFYDQETYKGRAIWVRFRVFGEFSGLDAIGAGVFGRCREDLGDELG